MSRPLKNIKQASGKVAGSVKNAGTQIGGGSNSVKPIKGAVGMCSVGNGGYAKIKGAVSG